jgi:hypothetical protein
MNMSNGKWVEHYNDGWPLGLLPSTKVIVKLEIDGHITEPMRADDVDWCHEDDPVARYQVVREN